MRANDSTVVCLPSSKWCECCGNCVAVFYQLESFSAPASSNKEWLSPVSSVGEKCTIAGPKTCCSLAVRVSDSIKLCTSLCKICPNICAVGVHSSNIVDSIEPYNWAMLQNWIGIAAPKKLSASFIHASLYPIAVLAPNKYFLPTLSQKPALLSAVLKHGIKFITRLSS